MADKVTKRTLQLVNRNGNASSPYESEDGDDWLPEASYTGKDCDSYASWKKRQILRMDWEMNRVMAIATCWTETMEYHAVLLVYLDGVVYVLDNRHHWVMPIQFFQQSMGYNFDRVPGYMQAMIKASEEGRKS